MGIPIRVLLAEDNEDDAELTLRALRAGGYEPTVLRVESAGGLRAALETGSWDVILSDHRMPSFTSVEALSIVQERGVDVPFVIVSGTIGEEAAVAAMRQGAHDYILKGNLARLAPAIERELHEAEERRAHREAEATILRLAYLDTLTGLPNRAHLMERLEEVLARSGVEQRPLAILMVCLLRFREINGTLGHHNGDVVLKEAARRLSALEQIGLAARIGASKFALVCPGHDAERALAVAVRAVSVLQTPMVIGELPIEVGAGVGVAVYPGHGEDAELLLRRADVGLEVARRGPEPTVLYRKEIDTYDPRRLILMGELRKAIETDQLRLEYQPKIDLRTKQVVGVEALLRWTHATLGHVRPDEFIGLAEESGLIRPLTRWVLREAIGQCRAWRHRGLEIGVSLNLSVRNLEDPELPTQVESLLETWGVSPAWVTLEVTESAIMAERRRAERTLARLHDYGVSLSIDDFGTGYSSLAYLRRLPVSELKIDRSFVIGLSSQQGDLTIVRTVVDLGHHLGLRVTAEGVEDAKTWDLLASAGCDLAQGYYMARPMPAADFEGWAARSDYGLDVPAKQDAPPGSE